MVFTRQNAFHDDDFETDTTSNDDDDDEIAAASEEPPIASWDNPQGGLGSAGWDAAPLPYQVNWEEPPVNFRFIARRPLPPQPSQDNWSTQAIRSARAGSVAPAPEREDPHITLARGLAELKRAREAPAPLTDWVTTAGAERARYLKDNELF